MVSRLEEMSAVKVVVEFCCQPEIKREILNNSSSSNKPLDNNKQLFKINKILQQKFSNQFQFKCFPFSIIHILPNHIIPIIVKDMIKWMRFQSEWFGLTFPFCMNYLEGSCFTNKGRLKRVLANRKLVQDERLDVLLRMGIAIVNCSIEDIKELWRGMSETEKNCISQRRFINEYPFRRCYWKYYPWKTVLNYATKDENIDENDILWACESAIYCLNEEAFKNIWMRLRLSTKENVVEDVLNTVIIYLLVPFPDFELIEMFRILVCDVDEETLKILLQDYTLKTFSLLNLFLPMPNQDLFLKMINILWDKITDGEFYMLLHSIADKIDDYNCRTYKFLLKEIWLCVPSYHRKKVITWESEDYDYCERDNRRRGNFFLLRKLFSGKSFGDYDDISFINLFKRDATQELKRKILNKQGNYICKDALLSGRLNLADLFIRLFAGVEFREQYKRNFLTWMRSKILDVLDKREENCLVDNIKKWAPDFEF
ncbi:UNVERIFIED_CONTAM: hypothetical protein RMT77_016638 [Armadillidium vulgare]